jgi:hypothetical protein
VVIGNLGLNRELIGRVELARRAIKLLRGAKQKHHVGQAALHRALCRKYQKIWFSHMRNWFGINFLSSRKENGHRFYQILYLYDGAGQKYEG